MRRTDRVVVVGESVAGTTAARELRARGHAGSVVLVGDELHGSYSRPALSKAVLTGTGTDVSTPVAYEDLDIAVVRSAAVQLDPVGQTVSTSDGATVSYDALVVATGAVPRRLAGPGQHGELVLRTLDDAHVLRERLDRARSAVVIGAGFLGMEVASACSARRIAVTVLDVDAPLARLLGTFLSRHVVRLAASRGVQYVRVDGPVRLLGDPVRGVVLPDGATMTVDVVVSCVGDLPATAWLDGAGIADPLGVAVDSACATGLPGVFAAGDVSYLATLGQRRASWSNAVAQGRVAAASVLGLPADVPPFDDYVWTELFGVHVKVAGPLGGLVGDPSHIDGSVTGGDALLSWQHEDGGVTAVAFGRRTSVRRLRALAASRRPV